MDSSLDTPGSYLLLLKLDEVREVFVGRSRRTCFTPGLYCYVGSARGPGGLRARLSRHASRSKRKHWHIDYLLDHARLTGALVIESKDRAECALAKWVGEVADSCVLGFGSSDCTCEGHLFLIGSDLPESRFVRLAEVNVGARHVQVEELNERPG